MILCEKVTLSVPSSQSKRPGSVVSDGNRWVERLTIKSVYLPAWVDNIRLDVFSTELVLEFAPVDPDIRSCDKSYGVESIASQ